MKPVTANEVVNVPVPVAALPLIHEALDRYYKSLSVPVVERITVPGKGDWSRDEILALHGKLRNHAGREVMRFIAENADKKVTYGEIAQAANISLNQLRAQLAWLSRHSIVVRGRALWPMTVTENSALPAGERYQYRMDKGIARWWLQAEAAANEGVTNG